MGRLNKFNFMDLSFVWYCSFLFSIHVHTPGIEAFYVWCCTHLFCIMILFFIRLFFCNVLMYIERKNNSTKRCFFSRKNIEILNKKNNIMYSLVLVCLYYMMLPFNTPVFQAVFHLAGVQVSFLF